MSIAEGCLSQLAFCMALALSLSTAHKMSASLNIIWVV